LDTQSTGYDKQDNEGMEEDALGGGLLTGHWNKMAHAFQMGTVFCWEIHGELKGFLQLRGILIYMFSPILSCVCKDMDNKSSDNSNSYITQNMFRACVI
jgi:hypothetical protein